MRIETDTKIERRVENIQSLKEVLPRFDLRKNYKIEQAQVEVALNAFSFNDELIDYVKGLGTACQFLILLIFVHYMILRRWI